MVLSTRTAQHLFSISRCGMTHLIKDCSGILQIPHKSPLIKNEAMNCYEKNNQTKAVFPSALAF